MRTHEVDVLVVGAGPAGLTVGIALARQGVDVQVVDRHAGTSPFPKATGLSTRTMELLRLWGLEPEVRAGAMRVQARIAVSETLLSPVHTLVPFGYPTEEQAHAVSPTSPCYCPQDHLEPVLARDLRRQGGRLRFGTAFRALHAGPDRVTVELAGPGGRYRVVARYLVGADGPRSTVRAALGIGLRELGSLGEYLAVTFRAGITARLPHPPSTINAVQVPGGAGILLPTDARDRWIHAYQPEPGAPVDLGVAAGVERIRLATGMPDLEPEILSVSRFEIGAHIADRLRAGRGFLVGDAAHRTTPEGGIGMNTAIHGAHNLGWRLGWVLRGWAGEELLNGYEVERRPVGLANALRSLSRDAVVDGLAVDVGVSYGEVERAPHAWVRHGGRRVSTLELFDGRLTVLTGSDGGSWRRAVAALAPGGPPVAALTVGRDLDDPDGGLERGYRLGPGGVALVRPDGYLAWRQRGPVADPGSALRAAVAGVLAPRPPVEPELVEPAPREAVLVEPALREAVLVEPALRAAG